MILRENKGNLFELDDKYTLMQCISLDCAMGRGIAVEFEKRFRLRQMLQAYISNNNVSNPTALLCKYNHSNNVMNLITKERYYNKPTYKSFTKAVQCAVDICIRENIRYIGTYKLGCCLDRLKWDKVKEILEEEFRSLDIEIEVRYQ